MRRTSSRSRAALAADPALGYTYFHMSSPALDVRSFSRLFKALGDETRLRIVALLSHGELCVCHLEDALARLTARTSPATSASSAWPGVVEHRREGSWVYYRLAPPGRSRLRATAQGLVKHVRRSDPSSGRTWSAW